MILTLWLFLKKPPSPILAIVLSILYASMFFDLVEGFLPAIAIRNIALGLVKGKPSQEHSWAPVAILSLWLIASQYYLWERKRATGTTNFGGHPCIDYYVLCSLFLHIFNIQASKLNNFEFAWLCKFNFASANE